MRGVIVAALLLALAGCAGQAPYQPPPEFVAERDQRIAEFRAREEEQARRQQAALAEVRQTQREALGEIAIISPGDLPRWIRFYAERNAGPAPAARSPARSTWDAEVARQSDLLRLAAQWQAERTREARDMHERLRRQADAPAPWRDESRRRHEYCADLAQDIAGAGASLTDLLARQLGAPLRHERSLYNSCMSGFERTDRYLAR